MRAKPDLRVVLKWTVAGSGSVIEDVIPLKPIMKISSVRNIAIFLGIVFAIGWMLLPDLSTPKEHTQGSIRLNRLRQLAMAVHEFEQDHDRFPFITYQGENRLSWRISLLPYLGEQSLYDQIDKTVSWDHPQNRPFHSRMPSVFGEPSAENPSLTPYLAITGEGTGWPQSNKPLSFTNISDGTTNTIALVALPNKQMNWLSPETLTLAEFVSYHKSLPENRLYCALFDASSHRELPEYSSSDLEDWLLISNAE